MIYLWKYYPDKELEDNEENDIQICITLASQNSFIDALSKSTINEELEFQTSPLEKGEPHHIDAPHRNFYLPHIWYDKLKIIKRDAPENKIEIAKTTLTIIMCFHGQNKIIDLINETNKAPSLYENFVQVINQNEIVRLNFWGSYEDAPVYF